MEELKVRKLITHVVVCPLNSIDEDVYVNQGQCKTCDYCLEYKSKEYVKCICKDRVITIKGGKRR